MRQLLIKTTITPRDHDVLQRYFKDVEKIRLLTPTEEEQLCRQISAGDHTAVRRLVLGNLRFVISVAKQYQTPGISLNDLVSEGNIGLIQAAWRFDHTKGFRFISYAVWWIRQAITTAVGMQNRFIHLPMNQVTLLNRYTREAARIEQHLQRKPLMEEVAPEIGVTDALLAAVLMNAHGITSLDRPISESSAASYHEIIPHKDNRPDELLIRESVTAEIEDALKILDRREREMLILFFGLCKHEASCLENIAERFGLSVEHTRRIRDRALEKLRCSSHAPALMSCLT